MRPRTPSKIRILITTEEPGLLKTILIGCRGEDRKRLVDRVLYSVMKRFHEIYADLDYLDDIPHIKIPVSKNPQGEK